MATITHGVALNSTSNTATYTTASFTPAVDDLLVAFAGVTATANAGAMTDSLGGTWTAIRTATKAASADKLWLFVRGALSDGSALTVTMDVTGDNGTGCIIFVARVAGMSRVGGGAVVQHAAQSDQTAGTTPAPVFPANCDTNNPTLGFVFNATNPAGMTPPTSWVEPVADTGYATPTTGGEYVARNSGFAAQTITWGSTSVSIFGDITVEMDSSVPAAAGLQDSTSLALMGVGH